MQRLIDLFAFVALSGCVSVTSASAPTTRTTLQLSDLDALAIVQARNTVYEELVAAEDVEGLVALHTRDYQIFQPGQNNVAGTDNLRAYWIAAFENMNGLSVDEKTVSFAGPETIISHDFYQTFQDGEVIGGGQSVIVWKRVDGVWLVHWEMYN